MRLGLSISTVLLALLPLSAQSAYVMRKEESSSRIGQEENVIKEEPPSEKYSLENAILEEWEDLKPRGGIHKGTGEAAGALLEAESKATAAVGVTSGGNLLDLKAETVDVSSASSIAAQKAKEQEKAEAEAAHTAMMKTHFTSMVQARQSHRDVTRILDELESADTVIDGFVQPRIPMQERIDYMNHISMEASKDKGNGFPQKKDKDGNLVDKMGNKLPDKPESLAETDKTNETRHYNAKTSSTGGQFGFFAAERPHELRLDPENMKVYSWSTFKLLHPEKHLWNLEPMWKKLPKAPHKVHINRNKGIDGHSAASLLDQDMQPLVYIKDVNGFYHQGEGILTSDEIEKSKHPVQYQALLDKEQEKITNKDKYADQARYSLYVNQSENLQRYVDTFRTGNKFEQDDARDEMQMLRGKLAVELKIHPTETKGRGIVNVHNRGRTKTYHIEIDQVTVKALKLQLEKDLGIPWEAQILRHKARTALNNETMNEYCRAHTSRTFDLIQGNPKILEAAMRKRGTWKAKWDYGKTPTAVATSTQIKDEPQANAHGSASLLEKDQVKATSVADDFAEMRDVRKKLTTNKKAKHRMSKEELKIARRARSIYSQPKILLKTEADSKDEAKPALKTQDKTARQISQDEEWARQIPTQEEADWVQRTEYAKIEEEQRLASRRTTKKAVPKSMQAKAQMKSTIPSNKITDTLQTNANDIPAKVQSNANKEHRSKDDDDDDTEGFQATKQHHRKKKHHRGHAHSQAKDELSGEDTNNEDNQMFKADKTDGSKADASLVQQTLSAEEQILAKAEAKVIDGEKKLEMLRQQSPTGSLSQKVVAQVLGERSYATDLPNIVARHRAPKKFIREKEMEAAERTTWVREEDGTIHVAKHEVATKHHKLKANDKNFGRVDRGIPVDVLLEEEDPVDGEDFHKPRPADMPVLLES